MKVLDFMNTHKNWEELLSQQPYNIKVKRDGDYILLKYNQLSSDFSNEIVRECRGSIFCIDTNGKYACMCRAFDKFGNYGESYTAEIDWNSVVVEEKVDGSLIKFWFDGDDWQIATNGTINAFKAFVGDTDLSFGDLVCDALECECIEDFFNNLDTRYNYMFELVSPKSRATISYPETKLYYLGQRNLVTMKEVKLYEPWMHDFGILFPKCYNLNTLNACLEYVKTMTKDEEGFVIRDKNFNRMKLKSPEYLLAFHMNNNGAITTKRIIEMIKNEQIDDFVAYCPEYKDMVDHVIEFINSISVGMESSWNAHMLNLNKKELAHLIKNCNYKDFLFKKYDNNDLKAIDFIMSRPTSKIKDMIERLK